MPREFLGGKPSPAEKFIGENDFGITLSLIQEILKKLRQELLEVNEALALTAENFSKQFPSAEIAKQQLKIAKSIKSRDEAILAASPEQILQSLQEIYNIVLELEKRGLNKESILLEIKTKNPDLIKIFNKYYTIARTQHWGYFLGQRAKDFK